MWNSGSNAPTLIHTWEKDSRNFKKLKRKKNCMVPSVLVYFESKNACPGKEKRDDLGLITWPKLCWPQKVFWKKNYILVNLRLLLFFISNLAILVFSLLACTWHIDMFYFLHTFLNSNLSNFNWLPTSFT